MDKIIKAIVCNKIHDIQHIMNNNKISKDNYEKLYIYLLYFYSKGLINGKSIYCISFIFFHSKKIMKIKDLNNYNDIISWHILRKKTNNSVYELLKVFMDLYITKKRIKTSIELLRTSKNISDKIGEKTKKYSKLSKIILNIFIDYPNHYNDKITQNNIMIANTVPKSIWIHEIELENRLISLVKYYGIYLLEKLGVKIINSSYFSMLSFDEKVLYYKDCIGTIIATGKLMNELFNQRYKLKKQRHSLRHKFDNYLK